MPQDEVGPEEERNVAPEGDDEEFWYVDMAKSGTHWRTLERRRGNQRRYPRPEAEDAG